MSPSVPHNMPGKLQYRDAKALDNDIRGTLALLFPHHDPAPYRRALADVIRLHAGDYPGYRASTTAYHDLNHTLAVTLACVRVMHGIHLERTALAPGHVIVGLLAALFHDTGYIQTEDDTEGTGAKYTEVHVDRSVDLMRTYLSGLGRPESLLRDVENVIRCTDLSRPMGRIPFTSPEMRLAGCALGSADILAQMADDTYVEKLPKLFLEFQETGTSPYETEYDLFRDTFSFHAAMQRRLSEDLDGVAATVRSHFRKRWGVDKDLYAEAIDKNLRYLDRILAGHGPEYKSMLRRSTEFASPAA